MNFLEESFIRSLVARLIQPGVVGLALVGSYARRQNTPHSDVDMDIFVETFPSETYILRYIDGLMGDKESKVLYTGWGLFKGLADAVAVQQGMMMESENLYFEIIQENMCRSHEWTRAFRLALGADIGDVNIPAYKTRGQAALQLYKQTARLFKNIITERHRDVIENTLQLVNHHEKSQNTRTQDP